METITLEIQSGLSVRKPRRDGTGRKRFRDFNIHRTYLNMTIDGLKRSIVGHAVRRRDHSEGDVCVLRLVDRTKQCDVLTGVPGCLYTRPNAAAAPPAPAPEPAKRGKNGSKRAARFAARQRSFVRRRRDGKGRIVSDRVRRMRRGRVVAHRHRIATSRPHKSPAALAKVPVRIRERYSFFVFTHFKYVAQRVYLTEFNIILHR